MSSLRCWTATRVFTRRALERFEQVLRKYKDRKIDLADACLIRLADQFGTADILTLDQDFAIYRWGKNKPFRVLPSADLHGSEARP